MRNACLTLMNSATSSAKRCRRKNEKCDGENEQTIDSMAFQTLLSDVISFERHLEGGLWWGNEHVALSVNDGRTYELELRVALTGLVNTATPNTPTSVYM